MATLTPDDIQMRWQTVYDRYSCAAGILALCYDAVLLFPKEVKYIYTGRWSFSKSLYVLVRYWALLVFVVSLWGLHAEVPPQTCRRMIWATGFITDIGQTAVVKTILVLRLRALFNNKFKVTVILFITMSVELTGITYAFVVRGKLGQGYTYGGFYEPLGCFLVLPGPAQNLYQESQTVAWASRLLSTSLELALTLVGLWPILKESNSDSGPVWLAALHKKHLTTPLIHIFYRDGLLFFVPTFVVSLLGFLAPLPFENNELETVNWSMWLAFVYMVCGTRLILNLRIVGCGFSESTVTQQAVSTMCFETPRHQEMTSAINSRGAEAIYHQ